jgi:hypothetical protein
MVGKCPFGLPRRLTALRHHSLLQLCHRAPRDGSSSLARRRRQGAGARGTGGYYGLACSAGRYRSVLVLMTYLISIGKFVHIIAGSMETFMLTHPGWPTPLTGCGMELFSDEDFEKHLHTQCGVWAVAPDKFHFYTDVNRATQKQVLKLRSHPWIPSHVVVRGFVFDLSTGELREVTPKDDK